MHRNFCLSRTLRHFLTFWRLFDILMHVFVMSSLLLQIYASAGFGCKNVQVYVHYTVVICEDEEFAVYNQVNNVAVCLFGFGAAIAAFR